MDVTCKIDENKDELDSNNDTNKESLATAIDEENIMTPENETEIIREEPLEVNNGYDENGQFTIDLTKDVPLAMNIADESIIISEDEMESDVEEEETFSEMESVIEGEDEEEGEDEGEEEEEITSEMESIEEEITSEMESVIGEEITSEMESVIGEEVTSEMESVIEEVPSSVDIFEISDSIISISDSDEEVVEAEVEKVKIPDLIDLCDSISDEEYSVNRKPGPKSKTKCVRTKPNRPTPYSRNSSNTSTAENIGVKHEEVQTTSGGENISSSEDSNTLEENDSTEKEMEEEALSSNTA